MKFKQFAISLLAMFSLLGVQAQAADVENGAEIHKNDCDACHAKRMDGDGTKMYTREDRKVDSIVRLESMVRMCDSNLNLQMFDDDMMDIVAYLNKTHYKFPEK